MFPFIVTPYLPFTDAAEHAAVMATLRHWADPIYAGPYALQIFRSQYLAYHVIGAALTAIVGDAGLANRLLLVLAGIALPLSFASLLRAAGRDERLAIFACLPLWSRPLVLGFLPFVASIPLALWTVSLFLRAARSRARPRGWALAAIATLLFYAHVSTWMIAVACSAAVVVLARRARLLLLLVPSGIAAGTWLLLGKLSLGGGTLADGSEIARMSVARSLVAMPIWVFDVWRGRGDELAAAIWWLGFLVVVLASVRAVGRYSRGALVLLYAPFACVLALYLVTPWRVGAAVMLNVRLAPLLVLFAFLATRLPRRGRLASAAIGLGLVANVVGGVVATLECRASQRELGDLDAVLDAMPRGSRLLTLNFDVRSRTTQVFPWAHVGAYHRVRGGGIASFSFTELVHWPLRYESAERPPTKPATWDIRPCSFRNDVDGRYYDLILVRGDVDPFAYEPPGPVFRRALSAGPMTLYRKESGEWPEGAFPDLGPCRRSDR